MPDYFDTGFCVRQPSWHGKETLLDDFPENWDEARRAAGLLWEPVARPLWSTLEVLTLTCMGCQQPLTWLHDEACPALLTSTGAVTLEQCAEAPPGAVLASAPGDLPRVLHVPVPGHKAIVRDDTGGVLGVPTSAFQIIGHGVMGEIVEAFSEESGVGIETAGAVKGGAQVWALIRLDEPELIAGDDSPSYPYLAILNAHDGSAALQIVNTTIRVVCWNTYQAAMSEGERSGRSFSFRHTGEILSRVEEAKGALTGARQAHAQWREAAEALAILPVSDRQVRQFVHEFIPEPPADVISDRVKANIEKARSQFLGFYTSETCSAHAGSALGLVDAAVEYLDHGRAWRTQDSYVGRTLLRPEPFKARAFALAGAVAADLN